MQLYFNMIPFLQYSLWNVKKKKKDWENAEKVIRDDQS